MKEKLSHRSTSKKPSRRKNFEIKFYENILKELPDCVNVLIPLGDAYTRKGFYQEGLAIDKKLVQLQPDDPTIHYNLSCSLSLLGRYKEALEELKKAVLFGYEEFDYICKDKDLEDLRKLPSFKTFFSKLKNLKRKLPAF
jgi:tetratricopeptide (TPR) repeat protein|tara:strand:+ start:12220 stop:12639 length:420 start_codon:yes stop_codon:yes gene_type:complete